jgi:drug/metabolite transporter (DMT)-like permease
VSVISAARHSRAWLGIAVAVAAGAAFAIANTSAGVAYQGGTNPLTAASTRFLLPTAALIAWLRFTRVPLVLPKRQAIVAVLLGAVTALYNWALLRSFNSIPFALAVLIIYLYPLIAAVIRSWPAYKRRQLWQRVMLWFALREKHRGYLQRPTARC